MRAPVVIRNARILAGDRLEETEGDILIQDGSIQTIGRVGFLPGARDLDWAGLYVAPGLIDGHVHFGLTGSLRPYEFWRAGALDRSLALYRNGLIALAAGVTGVRDLGAADHSVIEYSRQIKGGRLVGPTVVACGRFIVMTGGHGWDWGREADGADDVRRGVREQIRAGAGVIKFMATGGLSTPGSAYSPELTPEELKAGVEEAHKAGLPAAAHAHNSAGITAAVEAGIDTIEHAALATPADFQCMLEHRVTLVPTLIAISNIRPGRGVDDAVVEKTEAAREKFHHAIKTAISSGVSIVAGTDAGTALNPVGRVVDEVLEYVQLGMESEAALASATVSAGKLLGTGAGVIQEGAPADLIALRGDPRTNLSLLHHPVWTVARGTVVSPDWARATIDSLPPLGPLPDHLGASPRQDR